MSDLISRSELLESFRKSYCGHLGMENSDGMITFRSICRIINEQPTAYDIDKTVEELNKAKVILANEDYCRSRYEKKDCEGMNCFECCAEYLIEIVKHGKVDNDVCGWKQGKGGTGLKRYKASCCDKSLDMPLKTAMDLKYCPYCGKKIKVVEQ